MDGTVIDRQWREEREKESNGRRRHKNKQLSEIREEGQDTFEQLRNIQCTHFTLRHDLFDWFIYKQFFDFSTYL